MRRNILETAVGRARAGRDGVRWQGLAQACPAPCLGLRLRAHARKEEQRRQSTAAWLARVCSALTHKVTHIVSGNVCIHAVSPAESSGQLRFLGFFINVCCPVVHQFSQRSTA